jgi:hypothetical protein
MTYDWDGRRSRILKAAQITTGATLTLMILALPLLFLI